MTNIETLDHSRKSQETPIRGNFIEIEKDSEPVFSLQKEISTASKSISSSEKETEEEIIEQIKPKLTAQELLDLKEKDIEQFYREAQTSIISALFLHANKKIDDNDIRIILQAMNDVTNDIGLLISQQLNHLEDIIYLKPKVSFEYDFRLLLATYRLDEAIALYHDGKFTAEEFKTILETYNNKHFAVRTLERLDMLTRHKPKLEEIIFLKKVLPIELFYEILARLYFQKELENNKIEGFLSKQDLKNISLIRDHIEWEVLN